MLIELNEQEGQEFIQLLDVAVKAAGLQSVPLAAKLMAKIHSARQRETAGSEKVVELPTASPEEA